MTLTRKGRMLIAGVIVGAAVLVLTILIFSRGRFGPVDIPETPIGEIR